MSLKPKPTVDVVKSPYRSSESYQISSSKEVSSSDVQTTSFGRFCTERSEPCYTNEEPVKTDDTTPILDEPLQVAKYTPDKSIVKSNESQFETSNIYKEAISKVNSLHSEDSSPTTSKPEEYPSNPYTPYTRYTQSSPLPTYSPEIYIKDQPPEFYEVITQKPESSETSNEYKNIKNTEQDSFEEHVTSNGYKQSVPPLNGAFFPISNPAKNHSTLPNLPDIEYTTTPKTPKPYNIQAREPKLRTQFFPPIPSYISLPENSTPQPAIKTFTPPTYSIKEIKPIETSLLDPNKKQNKTQRNPKSKPQFSPPIQSHGNLEQNKLEKLIPEEKSNPKITSTYMQDTVHNTGSSSEHFLLKHSWNQLFKDDFPFPFGQITPTQILTNIAVLSENTAADREYSQGVTTLTISLSLT